jgi:hypothetical protein
VSQRESLDQRHHAGLESVHHGLQKTVPTRHLHVRWSGPDPLRPELQQAFGAVGELESVHLPLHSDKKYAFVNFRSFTAAKRAVDALDGKPLNGRGTCLAVGYTRVRPASISSSCFQPQLIVDYLILFFSDRHRPLLLYAWRTCLCS